MVGNVASSFYPKFICKGSFSLKPFCQTQNWRIVWSTRYTPIEEVEEGRTKCSEHIEAMEFLLSQSRKEGKEVHNKQRYKKTKVVNRLIKNGYGKNHADKAATLLTTCSDAVRMNPAEFDPRVVSVWKGDSKECKIFGDLKDLFDSAKPARDQKVEKVLEQMADEKKKYQGALSYVPVDLKPPSSTATFSEFKFSKGNWHMGINAFRDDTWRWGPQAWGLPGVGVFCVAISNNCNFQVFDVAALKGIHPKDIRAFLETPTGGKFTDKHCVHVCLQKSSICWIPFGHMVVPLSAVAADVADDAKIESEVGMVLTLHAPCVAWAKKVPQSTWVAIKDMNCNYLETQDKKMWKIMEEDFVKLCTSVYDEA